MSDTVAFLCGVTGTQGGAVARALRAKNVEVHALARDPTSDKAKAVEALGVKLWKGDYDNLEALAAATKGCTSVFLNLSPDFQDHSAEQRWCQNIIKAGKAAGAKHLVYSSGFACSNPEKLKYWDPKSFMATVLLTKQAIEKQTREAGYEYWTILRPGNFMANYLPPLVRMYPGLIDNGLWRTALTAESVMPMVNTATIGTFGAEAILNPQKYHQAAIEYCDELLLIDQIMEKMSKATGRELKAQFMTDQEIEDEKPTNMFIQGQLAMRDMVQFVNMEEVKKWGVPLKSFDEFLEAEKDRFIETYSKST